MIYFYLIVVAVLIIVFCSGMYFYNFSIKRSKKEFLEKELDLDALSNSFRLAKEWLNTKQTETVEIMSYDGLKLRGLFLASPNPSNTYAILVHGYTSKGVDMAGFAHTYHEKFNLNVLMPDLRGHGNSEGDYIGFGWNDRLDILSWIDYLMDRYGTSIEIILHGISMGAATVGNVSGEKLPQNVKFIVSDCAYDSTFNILSYHLKRMYKLPAFPILHVTSLICKLRANYYLTQGNAAKAIAGCSIPILLIHGDKDKFVPTYMVNNIYKNANCPKELMIIEGAGHGESHMISPNFYDDKIAEYLRKYTNGEEQ